MACGCWRHNCCAEVGDRAGVCTGHQQLTDQTTTELAQVWPVAVLRGLWAVHEISVGRLSAFLPFVVSQTPLGQSGAW